MTCATHDSPRSFWVAHAGPYGYQNPPLATVLRVASPPFSSNVAYAHSGNSVGLSWGFFLFSLMPLEFTPTLSKNNCILQYVILSILSYSFYYCLFCIWWFLKFSFFFFNFISRHFISFDFCIQFWSSCFFNVFYTYLWLIIFFSISSHIFLLHF